MKKKTKRKLLGIPAIAPAVIILIYFLITMHCYQLLANMNEIELETTNIYNIFSITSIMILIGVPFGLISTIGFFIHNIRNPFMPHDKKVGWGYLIVVLNVFALPFYWYNFILKKRC